MQYKVQVIKNDDIGYTFDYTTSVPLIKGNLMQLQSPFSKRYNSYIITSVEHTVDLKKNHEYTEVIIKPYLKSSNE